MRNATATDWLGDWEPTAKILVNGLRYSDVVSALKRIAKERKMPKAGRNCLAEFTDEAAKIKLIRDIVAHRDFTIIGTDNWRYEFKLWNRKSPDDPAVVYYWPAEIDRCAEYANTLAQRVKGELVPLLRGREIKIPPKQLQAWCEKPLLPKPPHQDSRRTLTEMPLQPTTLVLE